MSAIKKVLFIESGTSSGGSFESLYQYLCALDRSDVDPVVAYLNPNRYEGRVRALGVPVHLLRDPLLSVGTPRALRSALWAVSGRLLRLSQRLHYAFLRRCHAGLVASLAALAAETGAGLVYLNDQITQDFFGVFLAQRTGLPVISHLRSTASDYLDDRKIAAANQHVAAFVATSRDTVRFYEARGIDPAKLHLVYNAVPAQDAVPADLRSDLGFNPSVTRIAAFVGRLIEEKGVHDLMAAVVPLLAEHGDLGLAVVGDGPERGHLERTAAKRGIGGQVVFCGYREDVPRIMAAAEVLALPSYRETFGRVLVEAMAAGSAVVAYAVDGVSEIVTHGEDGLLAQLGDVAGLSAAVRRVLEDDTLREALVRRGRRTAAERFSMDRYRTEVGAIIDGVLAAHSP